MTLTSKVVAVVPAYNEAKTVGAVVKSLLPYVSLVVVVDNGSRDGTGDEARRAGAVVVRNDPAHGYDGALNAGFAEAARQGADVVMTFDADGEHAAEDVPRVLKPILSGQADMVLGQRPHTTHWGEKIFALYTRACYGVRDPLCGFKAYRRSVYDVVGHFDTLRSTGTQLFVEGVRRGFRLACVSIEPRARVAGDTSRFYALNIRGNIKILHAMWKIMTL